MKKREEIEMKFYEKLGYSNCGISENGNSYVYKKRIEKYL